MYGKRGPIEKKSFSKQGLDHRTRRETKQRSHEIARKKRHEKKIVGKEATERLKRTPERTKECRSVLKNEVTFFKLLAQLQFSENILPV